MNNNPEKNNLREKIKELKSQFSKPQKLNLSKEIFKIIENLPNFAHSKIVMAYWSLDDEVFTHDFIQKWAKQKTFLLPVLVGDEIKVKEYKGINEMQISGKYNISEPTGKFFEELNKIDLIIVPGIAFDKNKNRLGRGKAYYDKFLPKTNALKIGVCFNFQLFDKIPAGEKDVKMDIIITEKM